MSPGGCLSSCHGLSPRATRSVPWPGEQTRHTNWTRSTVRQQEEPKVPLRALELGLVRLLEIPLPPELLHQICDLGAATLGAEDSEV
jgi:hypothetical protein